MPLGRLFSIQHGRFLGDIPSFSRYFSIWIVFHPHIYSKNQGFGQCENVFKGRPKSEKTHTRAGGDHFLHHPSQLVIRGFPNSPTPKFSRPWSPKKFPPSSIRDLGGPPGSSGSGSLVVIGGSQGIVDFFGFLLLGGWDSQVT